LWPESASSAAKVFQWGWRWVTLTSAPKGPGYPTCSASGPLSTEAPKRFWCAPGVFEAARSSVLSRHKAGG